VPNPLVTVYDDYSASVRRLDGTLIWYDLLTPIDWATNWMPLEWSRQHIEHEVSFKVRERPAPPEPAPKRTRSTAYGLRRPA
jgi:hypothetical protein